MNPLTVAMVFFSSLPAMAQDQVDRLREENLKLRVDAAAQAARIAELEMQLKKEKILSERDAEHAALEALRSKLPTPAVIVPPPTAAPNAILTKPRAAKVSAYLSESGQVVLTAGTDHGIREKSDFTIHRRGEYVAKIQIDRVEQIWSTGKIVHKMSDPRVGDDVSNSIYLTAPSVASAAVPDPVRPALSPKAADELAALRKELDDVRNQVRQLSDRLVPSFQGPGVSVEEAPEPLIAHLGVLRGLLVRRVREGSPAEKAGLRSNDVIPDLLEAQLLDALESGMPIHVVRKGQALRLAGSKGR